MYSCSHSKIDLMIEIYEGYLNGSSEMYSRMAIFQKPLKVNAVIEALGIFHRSKDDHLERKSELALFRKLGYLAGILETACQLTSVLDGTPISERVKFTLGLKYIECLMQFPINHK